MNIEIDQSGKIENTNKLTVLAFSNTRSNSVILLAKDKRYIQRVFRKAGQPKLFAVKTFAIGIFYLLKNNLRSVDQMIIDREYPGYERLIKRMILEIFEKNKIKIDPELISFRQISKKSRAHQVAYQAYKNRKADKKLSLREITKALL